MDVPVVAISQGFAPGVDDSIQRIMLAVDGDFHTLALFVFIGYQGFIDSIQGLSAFGDLAQEKI